MGRNTRARQVTTHHDQPMVSRLINDNYCAAPVCARRLTGSRKSLKSCQTLNVNSLVSDHVPFAVGQPKKKGLSPVIVKLFKSLKYVKEFCLECLQCPSCCSRSKCRGQIAQILGNMGAPAASPKVIRLLREDYTLPFRIQLNLTRSLTAISGYVYPLRNSYQAKALHALMQKCRKSIADFFLYLFQDRTLQPSATDG